MSKYAPLGEFLRLQNRALVPMSFEEIERVTGVALPIRASSYPAWWSNNPTNNVMTRIWLEAGYKTEQVDIAGRRLVFRRVKASPSPSPLASEVDPSQPYPLFGWLKGLVHIPAETDLTAPADPDWGNEG